MSVKPDFYQNTDEYPYLDLAHRCDPEDDYWEGVLRLEPIVGSRTGHSGDVLLCTVCGARFGLVRIDAT